jgi:hypothetical protein
MLPPSRIIKWETLEVFPLLGSEKRTLIQIKIQKTNICMVIKKDKHVAQKLYEICFTTPPSLPREGQDSNPGNNHHQPLQVSRPNAFREVLNKE